MWCAVCVFMTKTNAIYSLGYGLHTVTAVHGSTHLSAVKWLGEYQCSKAEKYVMTVVNVDDNH